MGARLPQYGDYINLVQEFDHVQNTIGYQLTEKGIQQIEAVFPDMKGKDNFWTASEHTNLRRNAYIYSHKFGKISLYAHRRHLVYSIRCIL